jgi:hypothetical protein
MMNDIVKDCQFYTTHSVVHERLGELHDANVAQDMKIDAIHRRMDKDSIKRSEMHELHKESAKDLKHHMDWEEANAKEKELKYKTILSTVKFIGVPLVGLIVSLASWALITINSNENNIIGLSKEMQNISIGVKELVQTQKEFNSNYRADRDIQGQVNTELFLLGNK